LFVAVAVLVPAQPSWALGIEIELVALFWVYRTAWAARTFGPSMRTADRPNTRWQLEWIVWLTWLVALVAGGLVVLFGGEVGFDLLALAMVGMFLSAVWNAWVLISEVAD
jgi:hypothetical protein